MSIENRKTRRRNAALNRSGRKVAALAVASTLAVLATPALAFEIDTGNPEVKIHWDTQVKYTAAFRIQKQSNDILANTSQDEGDRNFDQGLISNRFDVFTEFDVSYRGWGARASAAGWYDFVYNRSNDNDSPSTFNGGSGRFDRFADATRDLHGRKYELLDAFIFGRADIGGNRLTFRAGRHGLLWGETLFLGANGIGGGMAPIDIVKAQSVPNLLLKELIRPVGQVSAQYQLSPDVSVGAYYQYEWERHVFPGAGSYFSSSDGFDEGGRFLTPPFFPGDAPHGPRMEDDRARQQGQFGGQIRFRIPGYDPDFGIYGIHYHGKAPADQYVYISGGVPVGYKFVYPEDITAVGASVSNTFGYLNLAAETSIRFNAPLAGHTTVVNISPFIPDGTVLGSQSVEGSPGFGDADHPLYASGHTYHLNVSALYSVPPYFLAEEGNFSFEVAWSHLLSVTKNSYALQPTAQREGVGFQMAYEPVYRQVLPGLDISVPMGFSYTPMGNDLSNVFQVDDGGSANIGVSFTYLDVWRAGIQYTRFIGEDGFGRTSTGVATYDQALEDRDFVSINIRRTF